MYCNWTKIEEDIVKRVMGARFSKKYERKVRRKIRK